MRPANNHGAPSPWPNTSCTASANPGIAYKVALYLNCAGLDWEPVFTDYFAGATRDPQWRATVNEMGEVPVLEHAGKKLTQSGVILTYLADKTGKFKPATEDARLEALRWILFDNHKFTSYFATYRFMKALAPQAPDPGVLAFLKGRLDGAARHPRQAPRPRRNSSSATRRPSPTSR